MRAAIYFTPPPGAPLTLAAAEWLGRDAFGSATPPAPFPAQTRSPRRYGFHATIKAPFRLAEGRTLAALDQALAAFAASNPAVHLPALALARLEGFFALVPAAPSPPLASLAASVVESFEPFRAPLTKDEIAKRRPETLSPAARHNLERWGYPHVMDAFQFHMTLTDRVPDQDAGGVESELRARFAPFIGQPLAVDGLAVFTEPLPGADFAVHALHPLRAG